jgi:aryl-alcohol dehydrogenase-like predicted oxidoreductase
MLSPDIIAALMSRPWVLSRGSDIVPLIGTKRRDRLAEALGALELQAEPRTTWPPWRRPYRRVRWLASVMSPLRWPR